MTESMIERVAKAIKGELPEFTGVTPEYLQALYKNAAEAAIEAMREPTETMKDAGAFYRISTSYGGGDDGSFDYVSEDDAAGIFGLMIDAALKWPAGSADRAGVPMAED